MEESLEENRELRTIATDFGRVKTVIGVEQVNAVIDRAKQQEQIEAEQKQFARRKYSREVDIGDNVPALISCFEVNLCQLIKKGIAIRYALISW